MHTLLTMSLTASIAAGGVMLLRLLLKGVPRWITCLLWSVVLLRMVCPVGFSLPVSLMPETVSSGAYVERVLPQQAPAAETQTAAPAPSAQSQTQTAGGTTTVALPPQQNTDPDRDTVLLVLWAAGGLICLAWGAVSYLRLRLKIADAILVEKNIYETDQIDSPFVCGFFRPRIYLPVGLAEPDRRYVLLHEQAHIRRRDYLTKPLAYVALCFHWFNPVLWLAYHLFGRDIETATDQAVIRSFGRTDTAGYAAALLHLGHKPSFPQAVPLAFGEENPKHRIRSVLSYKKPAFWVILAAVAACVVLGVLLLADLRPGMTQLGTSQTEPTVAYADGTAYAIQLDGETLVRSNGGTWVSKAIPDLPKEVLNSEGNRTSSFLDTVQAASLKFACEDPQIRTAQGDLVVYTYDPDTTNAPSPWIADHTLYVARYENGSLTTILEEDNVLPRVTDAALLSPNGDKLLFLCATLGHEGPGAGVRQECWVYDLKTGKHTVHLPDKDETGQSQLIGTARWLDNDTLLITQKVDTFSQENDNPFTVWTAKA